MVSVNRVARTIAPHGSLILTQLIIACYIILSRVIVVQGISVTVFLVYSFILATLLMALLAYIFERKKLPPLTMNILCGTFLLAFIGVTFTEIIFSTALYFTSSTIESSVLNMIPAITYILSLITKQEKLQLQYWWGNGKLFGTILSVSGSLILVFWHNSTGNVTITDSTNWAIGLVMVIVGVLASSIWMLMLEPMTKKYPAELSMTSIMFFFATLQTGVVAVILNHKASQWQLKWDLELLSILVGGALNSGFGNFIIVWCAGMKGPVFVASFSPLGLLFTTIIEILFLGHRMNVGSIIGSIVIVVGLYIYLWSKSKEEAQEKIGLDEAYDEITSSLVQNQHQV